MRPAIQCAFCDHFRSPLDVGDGTGGPTCKAFPVGIPDPIWLGGADHRKAYPGDNGIRWSSLDGSKFPESALAPAEEKAFLEQMAAKHLPGQHDQSRHGRHSAVNRAREAAQELEGLRESLNRAQERLGGRPPREDHAAADARLLGERLRRGGDQMGPSDVLARTQRQASRGNGPQALQARARLEQARIELARDRATVLARVEAAAFINEAFDDDPASMRRIFNVARTTSKLPDDPRLDPLGEALDSGDRDRVFQVLQDIAADLGVTRVGANPRDGYDQMVTFDRRLHRSISGQLQPGQQVRLVSPGYTSRDEGRDVVLVQAAVEEMDADEIAALRKHLPGRHDQSTHGRHSAVNRAAEAARELEELRESLARAQSLQSASNDDSGSGFRWMSPDDAMAMRQKMLADDPWTEAQTEALNRYAGDAYYGMNGLLRDDPEVIADLDERQKREAEGLIRDANAGMRPTTEPVKVKRFVSGFEAFGIDQDTMTREEIYDTLRGMVGRTSQEPGLMSTSLDRGYGKEQWPGKVLIELDVPAGVMAAYLDGDVGFAREQELVMAPGTRIDWSEAVIDPPRNTMRGRVVVE